MFRAVAAAVLSYPLAQQHDRCSGRAQAMLYGLLGVGDLMRIDVESIQVDGIQGLLVAVSAFIRIAAVAAHLEVDGRKVDHVTGRRA